MIQYKLGTLGKGSKKILGEGVQAFGITDSDIAFCTTKLKQVSRSFAAVITYLPNTTEAPLRLSVAVFYLVLRALDTVEDDMNLDRFSQYIIEGDRVAVDPRLAAKQRLLRTFHLRFQKSVPSSAQHLSGFGEGAERDLVNDLEVLVRVMDRLPSVMQAIIVSKTEEMAVGMADYVARDLRNGTADEADFALYCHIVAGVVGDGLTRMFALSRHASPQLVQRRQLWDCMGSFLQRANIIRDFVEDMVDGRAWWPRSTWASYAPDPASMFSLASPGALSSGASVRCLNAMIAGALELVPACLDYLDALSGAGVLSFCALPQVMAIATLAECYGNPRVFQGVVKIRKGMAARIMLDLQPKSEAQVRAAYLAWFVRLAEQIQRLLISEKVQSEESERVEKLCKDILARLHTRIH